LCLNSPEDYSKRKEIVVVRTRPIELLTTKSSYLFGFGYSLLRGEPGKNDLLT
jgi:hypothetical protein